MPRERLGLAFGVHRTLDTGGSLLGPLLAFGLLTLAPGAFDAVFVPSFCIGLLGPAVIVLFVSNPSRGPTPGALPSLRACARLLTLPTFRVLVVAAGALTLFTATDAFVYLGLQQRSTLDLTYFPLLYVVTALFYLLLALPAGRVADRVGRRRVFLVGQLGRHAGAVRRRRHLGAGRPGDQHLGGHHGRQPTAPALPERRAVPGRRPRHRPVVERLSDGGRWTACRHRRC